ncbi:hypothetical protein [Actinomadura hibisca]|uniref:hypothetical protein n=1 Tax=Actinomadura hibisca TaxID=68565 RepID=UPI00082A835F|nr:hypothetical protein [Actinomadura hibisca]
MSDRHVLTRVSIGVGAVLLAVTMSGCTGKKKSRGKSKKGGIGNSQIRKGAKKGTKGVADAPELSCADTVGDVQRARGKGRAPGWSDLKAVSWNRGAGGGALVSFTPAAWPPTSGALIYTTTVRQGALATFVHAKMAKNAWTVTSGLRKPVRLAVIPEVRNGAVTLALPRQLPVDGQVIDLTRPAQAGAEARVAVPAGSFRDPECSTQPPAGRARPRLFTTWPLDRSGS